MAGKEIAVKKYVVRLSAEERDQLSVSANILTGSASKSVVIEITSNRQRFEKAAEFCENLCCGDIVRDTD